MSASNARAFKYHTGLLKASTCILRGSPYRRNLGVISSIYMSASYEELGKSWKKLEKVGKSGKK